MEYKSVTTSPCKDDCFNFAHRLPVRNYGHDVHIWGAALNIHRRPKKAYLKVVRHVDPIKHARMLRVVLGNGFRLVDDDFGSEPWLARLGGCVSVSRSRGCLHTLNGREDKTCLFLTPLHCTS